MSSWCVVLWDLYIFWRLICLYFFFLLMFWSGCSFLFFHYLKKCVTLHFILHFGRYAKWIFWLEMYYFKDRFLLKMFILLWLEHLTEIYFLNKFLSVQYIIVDYHFWVYFLSSIYKLLRWMLSSSIFGYFLYDHILKNVIAKQF